jgi:hypothetical protein
MTGVIGAAHKSPHIHLKEMYSELYLLKTSFGFVIVEVVGVRG